MGSRVLLVEDIDDIAAPLVRTLGREGHTVTRVANGGEALRQLSTEPFELMILDLGLPDMDGLDVCEQARDAGFRGGILICTARGQEMDRVVGLDHGADDYLAKPFGLAELHARVRALLRRTAPAAPTSSPEAPTPAADPVALVVDAAARRVRHGGEEIVLTTKEFDVLALLTETPGAVVSRERLMGEVWDEHWFGSTKTLDVTIGRLRHKLEQAGVPARIANVRGVGFRLDPGAPDA